MIKVKELGGDIDASKPEQVRAALIVIGNTINAIIEELKGLDRRIDALEKTPPAKPGGTVYGSFSRE